MRQLSDRLKRERLIGCGLATLLIAGLLLFIFGWHVEGAYRHVVVKISNLDGVARVDVDCERAFSTTSKDGPGEVDLGWLPADALISISIFNDGGDAAWGFRLTSNDTVVEMHRGRADLAGFPAPDLVMVMEKSFTAGGSYLGVTGCDPPMVVSPELQRYQPLPDMSASVARSTAPRIRREALLDGQDTWSTARPALALIDFGAGWVLTVLAAVGWVSAVALRSVRQVVRHHWKASLAFAFASLLLNLYFKLGWGGVRGAFEVLGGALLLLSIVVSLWPHTLSRCRANSSTPPQKSS